MLTAVDGELERLWLRALQGVADRAAHELKDALNGVAVNLEVVRSRAGRVDGGGAGGPGHGAGPADGGGRAAPAVSGFAEAAAKQLDLVAGRLEALLFLSRAHREASPVDVAETLRHLAALFVPATKADGGTLEVEGFSGAAPTSAPSPAVRLALAAALLELPRGGGLRKCRLEADNGAPVVRFSHESAGVGEMPGAVASALAAFNIKTERPGNDLSIVFPAP